MIAVGEHFETDQSNNKCFACSQSNPQGLHMRFVRTGERSAECRYVVAPHHCGFHTVVHGGIQAALLDEVMSVTTNIHRERYHAVPYATAELSLQYKKPVPIGEELLVRAELMREEDRDLYISGAILDAQGNILTTANGRWRMLRKAPNGNTPTGGELDGTA